MTVAPHDALFKATFSQPERAAEQLRWLLPPELVARMDFASLAVESGSFVDDALRERHTDLLYSLRIDGRPARVYVLFEHQSSVDPWMPLRLLRYMLRERALRLVFSYLFEVRGADEFAVVPATVRDIETGSEQTMETIAQMLERRGRDQGIEQGRQEGRREMLLEMLQLRFGGLPEAVRQRVAAAEDAELGRWSRQLLQAQRLEDVFA